jgi:hypothetical protein
MKKLIFILVVLTILLSCHKKENECQTCQETLYLNNVIYDKSTSLLLPFQECNPDSIRFWKKYTWQLQGPSGLWSIKSECH